MISRAELKSLQQHRDYPSISILAPTHRTAPLNKQDRIKVENLARKAIDRLQAEYSKRELAPVEKQLRSLIKSVDWEHTLEGLALFASRDRAESVSIPFKVKARAIVDETFATRDLVYSFNRARPYRVLTLSQTPRLYDGWSTVLEEHLEDPFPLSYRAGAGKKLSRRQLMQRSDAREEDQRAFFKQVDDAVAAVHKRDPRPLVVVGVERNLAFYREVTKNADAVCGMLAGNHDMTSVRDLGKLVWPVFDMDGTRLRTEALVALDSAVSAHQHASGIDQVWRAAVDGKVQTLLVEKDFAYPAQLSEGGDRLLPFTGKGAVNLDDVVDEVIERVMETGGNVYFYPAGDLGVHQRIAAVLRR
jgi:hypothetical protein